MKICRFSFAAPPLALVSHDVDDRARIPRRLLPASAFFVKASNGDQNCAIDSTYRDMVFGLTTGMCVPRATITFLWDFLRRYFHRRTAQMFTSTVKMFSQDQTSENIHDFFS